MSTTTIIIAEVTDSTPDYLEYGDYRGLVELDSEYQFVRETNLRDHDTKESDMIRNFTPHPVTIFRDGQIVREIPSEGSIRLDESASRIDTADTIPVYEVIRTSTALPPQESGVYLVVSDMVRAAFPTRTDLLSPYKVVRDDSGRILGCEAFSGNR